MASTRRSVHGGLFRNRELVLTAFFPVVCVLLQDKKGGKLDWAIVEATEILPDGSIMCVLHSISLLPCDGRKRY